LDESVETLIKMNNTRLKTVTGEVLTIQNLFGLDLLILVMS
jgi:hypothetical protein